MGRMGRVTAEPAGTASRATEGGRCGRLASGLASNAGLAATLLVLGERDADTILAATVIAYSTAPDLAAGTIAAAPTGGQLQLLGDDPENDNATSTDSAPSAPTSTTLDASTATVLLNGSPAALADLAAGDHVLAAGLTNPDGSLTATILFAFNDQDQQPVPDNNDDQPASTSGH